MTNPENPGGLGNIGDALDAAIESGDLELAEPAGLDDATKEKKEKETSSPKPEKVYQGDIERGSLVAFKSDSSYNMIAFKDQSKERGRKVGSVREDNGVTYASIETGYGNYQEVPINLLVSIAIPEGEKNKEKPKKKQKSPKDKNEDYVVSELKTFSNDAVESLRDGIGDLEKVYTSIEQNEAGEDKKTKSLKPKKKIQNSEKVVERPEGILDDIYTTVREITSETTPKDVGFEASLNSIDELADRSGDIMYSVREYMRSARLNPKEDFKSRHKDYARIGQHIIAYGGLVLEQYINSFVTAENKNILRLEIVNNNGGKNTASTHLEEKADQISFSNLGSDLSLTNNPVDNLINDAEALMRIGFDVVSDLYDQITRLRAKLAYAFDSGEIDEKTAIFFTRRFETRLARENTEQYKNIIKKAAERLRDSKIVDNSIEDKRILAALNKGRHGDQEFESLDDAYRNYKNRHPEEFIGKDPDDPVLAILNEGRPDSERFKNLDEAQAALESTGNKIDSTYTQDRAESTDNKEQQRMQELRESLESKEYLEEGYIPQFSYYRTRVEKGEEQEEKIERYEDYEQVMKKGFNGLFTKSDIKDLYDSAGNKMTLLAFSDRVHKNSKELQIVRRKKRGYLESAKGIDQDIASFVQETHGFKQPKGLGKIGMLLSRRALKKNIKMQQLGIVKAASESDEEYKKRISEKLKLEKKDMLAEIQEIKESAVASYGETKADKEQIDRIDAEIETHVSLIRKYYKKGIKGLEKGSSERSQNITKAYIRPREVLKNLYTTLSEIPEPQAVQQEVEEIKNQADNSLTIMLNAIGSSERGIKTLRQRLGFKRIDHYKTISEGAGYISRLKRHKVILERIKRLSKKVYENIGGGELVATVDRKLKEVS